MSRINHLNWIPLKLSATRITSYAFISRSNCEGKSNSLSIVKIFKHTHTHDRRLNGNYSLYTVDSVLIAILNVDHKFHLELNGVRQANFQWKLIIENDSEIRRHFVQNHRKQMAIDNGEPAIASVAVWMRNAHSLLCNVHSKQNTVMQRWLFTIFTIFFLHWMWHANFTRNVGMYHSFTDWLTWIIPFSPCIVIVFMICHLYFNGKNCFHRSSDSNRQINIECRFYFCPFQNSRQKTQWRSFRCSWCVGQI